jgi:hypothetical protein
MKQALLIGTLLAVLAVPVKIGSAQTGSGDTVLGTVSIPQRVLADGQPLAAGTYQVRLASGPSPKPAVGQTPEESRYVEFVRAGQVAGREVATVISSANIGTVASGARPGSGSSRTELLRGGDYIRVWINQGGTHYLIHLPPA